jgi:hypothetical protein
MPADGVWKSRQGDAHHSSPVKMLPGLPGVTAIRAVSYDQFHALFRNTHDTMNEM